MKNITVSVDEETYRRARIKAAEEDTSVSALVKRFLADFASSGEARPGVAESARALGGDAAPPRKGARGDARRQLQLMEELWADLSRDEAAFDSPAWHEDAVRETAARFEAGEEKPLDWAAAKRQLRKRAK